MWATTIDDLSIFVAIARAGGVRPAAGRLGLPRSTVSRRILSLERQLGVKLLRRSAKGLRLTDVAHDYFPRIVTIVEAAEAVVGELSGQAVRAQGTLRIAASPMFADEFLAPLVERYARAHPEVNVELHLAIERIDLRSAAIDVAFRTSPLDDDDEYTAVRLGDSINGFYASPDYLRRRPAPRHPKELAGHDLVVIGEPGRKLKWRYLERNRERVVHVDARVVASTLEFSRQVCIGGGGIVRMPSFFACDFVRRGELVPILRPYWHRSVVLALFPRGIGAGLKTRAFVELCREHLADELRKQSVTPRCPSPRRSHEAR